MNATYLRSLSDAELRTLESRQRRDLRIERSKRWGRNTPTTKRIIAKLEDNIVAIVNERLSR